MWTNYRGASRRPLVDVSATQYPSQLFLSAIDREHGEMTKDVARVANIRFSLLPAAAFLVALAAALAIPVASAVENLQVDDSSNNRFSFSGTTAGTTNWPGNGPAVNTLDYFTNGKLLRAYAATGILNTVTFAGKTLTLDSNFQTRGDNNSFYNIGNLMTASGANARISNGIDNTSVTVTANAGGTISVASGATLTLNAGNTSRVLTMTAPLSGDGQVSVLSAAGIGTVVLSGTNTYKGDTTVQSTGRLQMGAANAMSNALATAGSGDLILTSGGTFRLAGKNTTINGLSGTGGTVDNIPATGDTAQAATLTMLGDNTSGGTNNTFSGLVTNGTGGGVLSLEKSGLGDPAKITRQIISGSSNDYTGTTKVSDGQLQFVGSGSLGTGAITVSTGANANTWGTLELSGVGSKGNAITLNGRTDATPHIESVGGAGTNTLSGSVTLTTAGKFNLAAGTGTTLNLTGPITTTALTSGTNELNLSGAGTGTITQAITLYNTATNTLNKTDGGTWTLSGAVSNLNALNASAGTLALGSGIAVAGDMAVGGTLQLGGASASANGLTGAGTLSGNGANTLNLTLGATGAGTKTFSGTIANGTGGVVGLTKTGDNTQILSGANTYTGQTTISGGTLQIQNGSALGGTAAGTSVQGTGTLALSGGISSAEAITLAGRAGGIGTDPAHVNNLAGNNTLSGGLALGDTAATTENYNIVSSGVGDKLTISGPGITRSANTETNNLNLGGAGNGEVSGVINMGAGATNNINKVGSGTWTLSNTTANTKNINANAGTLVFGSNTITYSGAATVNTGGTLKQGVAGAFDNKSIALAGGTLNLNGLNATLAGLNGSGDVTSVADPTLTLTGGGTYTGTITGPIDLTMSGAGGDVQILSGANTYTGRTTISSGTLQIENNSALGASTPTSTANTVINGTGTLALSNGITSAEALTLAGRSGTGSHIDNVAGTNTLTGAITLDNAGSGPSNFNIVSTAGTLTIQGGISGSAAGNARNLNLGGAGNGVVTSGVIAMGGSGGGGVATINKDGSGTWTLNSSVTGVDEIKANVGTLAMGAAAGVSTVNKFFVASGATIDATAVASNFNIGNNQTLYGAGTVKAPGNGNDVVAQSGATIDIGNGMHTDIATLSITGDMTLAAGSTIQINLNPLGGVSIVDLLAVSRILTVADRAKVAFYMMSGPLTASVYEFASYGTLAAGHGTFDVTTPMPTGYHIDYAYQNHYIALVSDIPVPAPLFLMGLGALVMGATRRYAKC